VSVSVQEILWTWWPTQAHRLVWIVKGNPPTQTLFTLTSMRPSPSWFLLFLLLLLFDIPINPSWEWNPRFFLSFHPCRVVLKFFIQVAKRLWNHWANESLIGWVGGDTLCSLLGCRWMRFSSLFIHVEWLWNFHPSCEPGMESFWANESL
jgi:hypothetical protein